MDTYGDEPQERSSEDVTGFETSAGFAPLSDYTCDTCHGPLAQVRGEWTCLRCDGVTICDALNAEVRKLREEEGMYPEHPTAEIPVAPEPEGYPCRVEGCPNRAKSKSGMYAYLCAEHAVEKKARKVSEKATAPPSLNGKVGVAALDEALAILELEREQMLQTVAQLEGAIDTVRTLRDARA